MDHSDVGDDKADRPAEPASKLGTELILPPWSPGERVSFFRPHGLGRVEIMHARNSARPWKVWHEHYVLAVVECVRDFSRVGASQWRYRGQDLSITPGSVMLMEPGECHVTRRVSQAGDFDVFQLAPSLVEQAAMRAGVRTPVHLRRARSTDPTLVRALRRLATCIHQPGQRLLQQQVLEQVLARVLGQYAESPAKPQRLLGKGVQRARDYIIAHHAEDFDLEALSAACGASKSAISHGLVEAIGIPPHVLRTMVRVEHAQRLLARGAKPGEVALQVGFYDQAQLTRHMKALLGVTPARYAAMVRR